MEKEKYSMKVKEVSKGLLNDGLNVRVSTLGLSMFPLIKTGDKITISPGKCFDIGNLIVFAKDEQMVCHRLVRVFETDGIKYYQTRGDSFFGLDEPVTVEQILGKVIRIERKNVSISRRLLLFIHPVLRFGGLNACMIRALIMIRSIFSKGPHRIWRY